MAVVKKEEQHKEMKRERERLLYLSLFFYKATKKKNNIQLMPSQI